MQKKRHNTLLTILALILGSVVCLLSCEGLAESSGDWKVTLSAFSYDMDAPKEKLSFSEHWLRERYGICGSSEIQRIHAHSEDYRYAWLKMHVELPTSGIEIKSIRFVRTSHDEDDAFMLIDCLEPMMIDEQKTDLQVDGAAVAYLKTGDTQEERIVQAMRAEQLVAQIMYTVDDMEKTAFVDVDTVHAVLERETTPQGFQIHMDYGEVRRVDSLLAEAILRNDSFHHRPDQQGIYYLCWFRGVKEKKMAAPVLAVSYALSRQHNDLWVSETNEAMYRQSGDGALPWCDDMYQDGSAYAEVRLLMRFEAEKTNAEIEALLKTLQLQALYSTDSYQYPFDKKRLGDGDHNSWRIGPRKWIPIDLSNCYIHVMP